MSLVAVLLLVVAAVTHAGWNLLGKSQRPTASFFLLANTVGCICLAPVLFFGRDVLPSVPPLVWLYILVTGLFMTVYYCALAGAYRAGDMSVAYPLARSSPVIVVAIVTVMLGRGHQVSPLCAVGIVLIVGGCFLLPMEHFTDFRLKNYLNATCLFALLAALGTTGYSMIDDEALRILRGAAASRHGVVLTTLVYASLEAVCTSVWLCIFVGVRRTGRADARRLFASNTLRCAITGVGIYLTYALVLVALAFTRNVSYVVAFRQLSIPLGAIVGILVLHEPKHMPKLVGVAVMFAGLVLVGIG